ncbi:unnamed protein product [Menidia menidia]|uniref:(Atlantic silverside) hypothetical protein n=1 Tax=Menidia menidia TaxID=238744 RepID=A0A8S4AL96_9TELE|nr:unnamed protein product [Menidia menidia]
MSRLQGLKVFISQRLTAAVDDILGQLERTILEYEEETERRHRDFLDVVLTAEMRQHRAEIRQLLVDKEGVTTGQQPDKSSSLDQKDPDPDPQPIQIKEELDEDDVTKLTFSPILVKSEDDDDDDDEEVEEPQSSQLLCSQTQDNIIILEEEDSCGPESETDDKSSVFVQPKPEVGADDYNVILEPRPRSSSNATQRRPGTAGEDRNPASGRTRTGIHRRERLLVFIRERSTVDPPQTVPDGVSSTILNFIAILMRLWLITERCFKFWTGGGLSSGVWEDAHISGNVKPKCRIKQPSVSRYDQQSHQATQTLQDVSWCEASPGHWWYLSSVYQAKLFLHTSQLYFLSAACTDMWDCMLALLVYFLSHTGQLKGFSPVWVRMCTFRLELEVGAVAEGLAAQRAAVRLQVVDVLHARLRRVLFQGVGAGLWFLVVLPKVAVHAVVALGLQGPRRFVLGTARGIFPRIALRVQAGLRPSGLLPEIAVCAVVAFTGQRPRTCRVGVLCRLWLFCRAAVVLGLAVIKLPGLGFLFVLLCLNWDGAEGEGGDFSLLRFLFNLRRLWLLLFHLLREVLFYCQLLYVRLNVAFGGFAGLLGG